MTLALADYEKRPTRDATLAALTTGVILFVSLAWCAFTAMPATGWWNDASFPADLAWIAGYWVGAYQTMHDANRTVWPILGELVSAQSAAEFLLARFDLAMPVVTRLAAALTGALVGAFAIHSLVLSRTKLIDTREHVEGLRLLRGKNAQASASRTLSAETRQTGFGIGLAPGILLSKLRELRGILILGATGSGKTRVILYLLDSIFQEMRTNPDRRVRVLIHDTTGEIAAGIPLDRSQFALVHGHKPGGHAWAMGMDIVTIEDAESAAATFASETEKGIWREGSVTLIAGCFVICQSRHGTQWGAPEFYETLLMDPVELRAVLEPLYPPAAQLIEIEPETGGLSRTTVSFFLSFRASVLRQLRPLARNWSEGEPFSFIDWLEDRPGQPQVVIVQRSGKYPELSAGWIGAVVDAVAAQANDESFSNSQTRRIFLCLDELAALKRIRSLPDLLDVGRNKGVAVIAALQEVEQLRSIYGGDQAVSLLKRFRTKIICQQNQDDATDQLSRKIIGMRTVRIDQTNQTKTTGKDGETRSTSTTRQEKEVPIVRGERLAYDLGVVGNKVRALVVGLGDIIEIDWPLRIWPQRHGRRAQDE